MKEIKEISSIQNPLIKRVVLLKEKSRTRKKEGVFILEGQRELQLAIKGGYQIQTLFFYEGIISEETTYSYINGIEPQPDLISVSKEVFQKLAYRDTTEGILAIVIERQQTLKDIKFNSDTPLILVAEAPEKPGNIGALLRTADAANVDAILIANPKTDLFNPNIIRSSVGCVFTKPIVMGSSAEIIEFLKDNNINIYCAALTASKNYTKIDFKGSTAIVVGTESTGLSNEWLENSTQNIIIPMQGEIDSMNVSVSAAIIIFEAKRQRGF